MNTQNFPKIKPAERHYAIQKNDPLDGALSSVAVGFDEVESGGKVDCPKPYLDAAKRQVDR